MNTTTNAALFRLFCLLFLGTPLCLSAQIFDQINDDQIRSVKLTVAGGDLSMPTVDVRAANGVVNLQFDHLGDELKDYAFTLVHCNRDWMPSELDPLEYIDGFTEDRITSIQPSFNTLTQYTHYNLRLPSANMRWTKSGNYLLQVTDKDDDNRVVLVRRFMVIEPLWRIGADFSRTARVENHNTSHEIDFFIVPQNARISNAQNDVSAVVLQNGRWDNAIGPIKPFIEKSESISFDYQDVVVFPAGKEFRFFDIRSFDFRGEHVKIINEKNDRYEVTLRTDKSRFDRPVEFRPDANGRFVISNTNANQGLLQCDYANVLFSIEQNMPLEDADVYVFGELSDWQLKPEFKMEYNYEARMYICEPFLKQGYYNYQYVVLDHRTNALDPDGFEGNWYETGNLYTILVYYHPFGSRYDRLMGAITLNSFRP
ncbi:MAG: DUF5103 domain-containing protein [Saprospiraceae bacterium]|nr:DUF5103 domain-containing protein [Saprospiraceae bacterium]